MSEFSHQWHIRVSQVALLQMLQEYWGERARAVDILPVPEDERERTQFEQKRLEKSLKDRRSDDFYLVSPTDNAGWTVVWPENPAAWEEELWIHLSQQTQAPILAGHCYSPTDTEHWAWIQNGKCRAEHWSFECGREVSGTQLDASQRPTGETRLDDAFAMFGRTYYHWRTSLGIVTRAGLLTSAYKMLLVRCNWDWQPFVSDE